MPGSRSASRSRWCCSGCLSLPVLWWLLRLIPPQPRRIDFPPTRLLFDIAPREETPQRTPWWLTLLRLTLAALVIIAAAGPLWNPPVATSSRQGAARAPDRRRLPGGGDLGRAHAHRRGSDRARGSGQSRRRAHPAVRADARHLLRDAGRGAGAAQADQAEAARGRTRGRAAGARPLPRRHARRRARLAHRRRRSRRRRRLRRGARPARRATPHHRGRGRHCRRARARRRRQRRGRAHREGVARDRRRRRERHRARARPQGPAARRCRLRLQGRRARDRGRAHAAGRDPQRHRAAGNRGRALGRRGGAARQALAPALDRRRHRLDRRHRAAAAWPRPITSRARSGRSPTCGSPSAARRRRP